MKNALLFSMSVVLFFISASELDKKSIDVTLTNTTSVAIKDGIAIIDGQELHKILGVVKGKFQILRGDKVIAFQLDDLNLDEEPDELLVMDDFAAGESREYKIVRIKTAPEFKKRTQIHFATNAAPDVKITEAVRRTYYDPTEAIYYQMEGPAWENEKVAFRNYFDPRNGLDIFGKQVEDLILDKVGVDGQNYHTLDDWGMDVLKVGASLGSGAIAIQKGNKLYRVDISPTSTYKLVKDGPIRSMLELKFEDFTINSEQYNITHRISIEAGKNYYQSDVMVTGLTGREELVTGIVNLHSDSVYDFEEGDSHVIYTHGSQSENKDVLGMAVIIPRQQFIQLEEAPDSGEGIVSTYLTRIKLEEGRYARYYFYSGWERQNKDFQSRTMFEAALKNATNEINHPIKFNLNH
jgi:hypothetical protein